jgi:hypothetical protein
MASELCPICIENDATYFTECGHKYCINCLCRIKKCAICRNLLLKSLLCISIKNKVNPTQTNSPVGLNINYPVRELIWPVNPETNIYTFDLRPEYYQSAGTSHVSRVYNPVRELIWPVNHETNIYTFDLRPEYYQSAGTSHVSRV